MPFQNKTDTIVKVVSHIFKYGSEKQRLFLDSCLQHHLWPFAHFRSHPSFFFLHLSYLFFQVDSLLLQDVTAGQEPKKGGGLETKVAVSHGPTRVLSGKRKLAVPCGHRWPMKELFERGGAVPKSSWVWSARQPQLTCCGH